MVQIVIGMKSLVIDFRTPTSVTASHQHLCYASCHQLMVPQHHCMNFGCLVFSVAGSMAWNLLPDQFCDTMLCFNSFKSALKNAFLHSTLEAVHNELPMSMT